MGFLLRLGVEASVLAVRILLVTEFAKRKLLTWDSVQPLPSPTPISQAPGVVSAPLWLVKAEPRGGLCSRTPSTRPLS